jgi:general secretion pathway protein A
MPLGAAGIGAPEAPYLADDYSMYRSQWGLAQTPFGSRPNPAVFYQSPTVEEALARLQFLVEEHRRLGLLLSGPGGGKTVLLAVLADQLKRSGHQVAQINMLGLSQAEFLWQLAAQWGMPFDDDVSPRTLWRAISDRLVENRCQQVDTVVLLDDADEAGGDALQAVARLAQIEPGREGRLTIIIAAQTSRVSALGSRLLELADLRVDLEPWEATDTESYVQSALKSAGAVAEAFEPEAVSRLHELAHGVPRRVNQLADLALLAAAGKQLPQVDAETVAVVSEELAAPR